MESLLDPEEGQKANLVLWCPEQFPANIAIEWEFLPIREPGLCILFFSAEGKQGEDIGLPVSHWKDDGTTYGPILGGGKIGFRQMSPLIAEYANFKVYAVEKTA